MSRNGTSSGQLLRSERHAGREVFDPPQPHRRTSLHEKSRPAVQAAFALHAQGREGTHRGLHRQQTASATCENKHTRVPLAFDSEKVSSGFDNPILLSNPFEFRCNISSIIPDVVSPRTRPSTTTSSVA